jgi:hypothetical protein
MIVISPLILLICKEGINRIYYCTKRSLALIFEYYSLEWLRSEMMLQINLILMIFLKKW